MQVTNIHCKNKVQLKIIKHTLKSVINITNIIIIKYLIGIFVKINT